MTQPEPNAMRIFQINRSDGGVPKSGWPQAEVSELGLVGDRQIHTQFHGGPERAVCIYSLELILALQAEGHPVFPGAMGENLTLAGIEWAEVEPGDWLQLGDEVLVEITRFTTPCKALIPYFMAGDFGRVSQTKNPGWARVYGRVLKTGTIRVGDRVELKKKEAA